MAVELSGCPGLVVVSEGSGASVCLVLGLSAWLHLALSWAMVFSLRSLSVVACAPSGVVLRCGVLAEVTVSGGVCTIWRCLALWCSRWGHCQWRRVHHLALSCAVVFSLRSLSVVACAPSGVVLRCGVLTEVTVSGGVCTVWRCLALSCSHWGHCQWWRVHRLALSCAVVFSLRSLSVAACAPSGVVLRCRVLTEVTVSGGVCTIWRCLALWCSRWGHCQWRRVHHLALSCAVVFSLRSLSVVACAPSGVVLRCGVLAEVTVSGGVCTIWRCLALWCSHWGHCQWRRVHHLALSCAVVFSPRSLSVAACAPSGVVLRRRVLTEVTVSGGVCTIWRCLALSCSHWGHCQWWRVHHLALSCAVVFSLRSLSVAVCAPSGVVLRCRVLTEVTVSGGVCTIWRCLALWCSHWGHCQWRRVHHLALSCAVVFSPRSLSVAACAPSGVVLRRRVLTEVTVSGGVCTIWRCLALSCSHWGHCQWWRVHHLALSCAVVFSLRSLSVAVCAPSGVVLRCRVLTEVTVSGGVCTIWRCLALWCSRWGHCQWRRVHHLALSCAVVFSLRSLSVVACAPSGVVLRCGVLAEVTVSGGVCTIWRCLALSCSHWGHCQWWRVHHLALSCAVVFSLRSLSVAACAPSGVVLRCGVLAEVTVSGGVCTIWRCLALWCSRWDHCQWRRVHCLRRVCRRVGVSQQVLVRWRGLLGRNRSIALASHSVLGWTWSGIFSSEVWFCPIRQSWSRIGRADEPQRSPVLMLKSEIKNIRFLNCLLKFYNFCKTLPY